MEQKAVSKKQLISEFGISYIKFRKVFNEYVLNNVIGYDYSEFSKIRILPVFLADNLRAYFKNGDTYNPALNSIHINIETGEKWVIENVNKTQRTLDLIALNNLGIVTNKRIVNISYKEFRLGYKENVVYVSQN
jgi:hypothetical protein